MKKLILVVIAGLMMGTLLYQGSMAFFHEETSVDTKISAKDLGISLIITSSDETLTRTQDGTVISSLMPGDVIDQKVAIENTKAHSLYVRVSVLKYWEDASGKKLPDADASLISLQSNGAQNWLMIDDAENSNSELVYFYYTKPMKHGDVSSALMEAIEVSSELKDQTYADYRMHISYDAEAIQAIAGSDAALSQWGVDLNILADGTISSVEG